MQIASALGVAEVRAVSPAERPTPITMAAGASAGQGLGGHGLRAAYGRVWSSAIKARWNSTARATAKIASKAAKRQKSSPRLR